MRPSFRHVLVLLAGTALIAACATPAPPRTPSPVPVPVATTKPAGTHAATATPSTSAQGVTDLPPSGSLAPGTYRLGDPFPVTFDLTLADGWGTYAALHDGVLLAHHDFAPNDLVLFGAWQIDTLYADPCKHTPGPAVGEGANDLVAALRSVPGLYAGEPVATTIDGRPATALELAFPAALDPSDCSTGEYWLWGFDGQNTRFIPPGYPSPVERLWILDVDGTTIALSGGLSGATDQDRADLDAIIRSIRFR